MHRPSSPPDDVIFTAYRSCRLVGVTEYDAPHVVAHLFGMPVDSVARAILRYDEQHQIGETA
jgi:hypothetical protein